MVGVGERRGGRVLWGLRIMLIEWGCACRKRGGSGKARHEWGVGCYEEESRGADGEEVVRFSGKAADGVEDGSCCTSGSTRPRRSFAVVLGSIRFHLSPRKPKVSLSRS